MLFNKFEIIIIISIIIFLGLMFYDLYENQSNYPLHRTIQTVCKQCDIAKEERASFILDCLKNANPKSDEEPEDWISLCEDMAEDIYCKKSPCIVKQIKNEKYGNWIDIDIKMIGE